MDGTAIGAVGKWVTEVIFEKVADAYGPRTKRFVNRGKGVRNILLKDR
ncbi:MAG: hypothetical protein ACJAZ9_001454 [Neolewinella sp.]